MTKEIPSPELLRKMLWYEPDTGKLYWRKRTPDMFFDSYRTAEGNCAVWNSKYFGKEAFTNSDKHGYKRGAINNKIYFAHRIIWAIEHGSWPNREIDHINGKPEDNRIKNLREATHKQNMRNQSSNKKNTSGYKGVCFIKARRKWLASIRHNYKSINLGAFDTPEEAHAAYCKAAEQYHKEFANTGVAT